MMAILRDPRTTRVSIRGSKIESLVPLGTRVSKTPVVLTHPPRVSKDLAGVRGGGNNPLHGLPSVANNPTGRPSGPGVASLQRSGGYGETCENGVFSEGVQMVDYVRRSLAYTLTGRWSWTDPSGTPSRPSPACSWSVPSRPSGARSGGRGPGRSGTPCDTLHGGRMRQVVRQGGPVAIEKAVPSGSPNQRGSGDLVHDPDHDHDGVQVVPVLHGRMHQDRLQGTNPTDRDRWTPPGLVVSLVAVYRVGDTLPGQADGEPDHDQQHPGLSEGVYPDDRGAGVPPRPPRRPFPSPSRNFLFFGLSRTPTIQNTVQESRPMRGLSCTTNVSEPGPRPGYTTCWLTWPSATRAPFRTM